MLPPIVARNGVSGNKSPSMFHVKQAGARWEATAANHTLQTLQRTHEAICSSGIACAHASRAFDSRMGKRDRYAPMAIHHDTVGRAHALQFSAQHVTPGGCRDAKDVQQQASPLRSDCVDWDGSGTRP